MVNLCIPFKQDQSNLCNYHSLSFCLGQLQLMHLSQMCAWSCPSSIVLHASTTNLYSLFHWVESLYTLLFCLCRYYYTTALSCTTIMWDVIKLHGNRENLSNVAICIIKKCHKLVRKIYMDMVRIGMKYDYKFFLHEFSKKKVNSHYLSEK